MKLIARSCFIRLCSDPVSKTQFSSSPHTFKQTMGDFFGCSLSEKDHCDGCNVTCYLVGTVLY